jgi:mRNA interferase MazF
VKRGDVVIVSAPGDFGKPRPAAVVQADSLGEAGLQSTVICLISSQNMDAPYIRMDLEPTEKNGLDRRSQIMVDKLVTVRKERISKVIGTLTRQEVQKLNRMLAFVMGLG